MKNASSLVALAYVEGRLELAFSKIQKTDKSVLCRWARRFRVQFLTYYVQVTLLKFHVKTASSWVDLLAWSLEERRGLKI